MQSAGGVRPWLIVSVTSNNWYQEPRLDTFSPSHLLISSPSIASTSSERRARKAKGATEGELGDPSGKAARLKAAEAAAALAVEAAQQAAAAAKAAARTTQELRAEIAAKKGYEEVEEEEEEEDLRSQRTPPRDRRRLQSPLTGAGCDAQGDNSREKLVSFRKQSRKSFGSTWTGGALVAEVLLVRTLLVVEIGSSVVQLTSEEVLLLLLHINQAHNIAGQKTLEEIRSTVYSYVN
jgi:hypothetical protein